MAICSKCHGDPRGRHIPACDVGDCQPEEWEDPCSHCGGSGVEPPEDEEVPYPARTITKADLLRKSSRQDYDMAPPGDSPPLVPRLYR